MVLKSSSSRFPLGGIQVDRDSNQSADNTELTISTSVGRVRRLLLVTVKYNFTVTKNVTITLNSGAGAAWDVLLQTIVLSGAARGIWIPDEEIDLADDDIIDVVAPAAGPTRVSGVVIYTKVL